MTVILYPERMYAEDSHERRIFGDGATIVMRDTTVLSELSDADCAAVEGLMIFRQWVTAADMARMPRLRAIVRMGVGYDRVDRVGGGGARRDRCATCRITGRRRWRTTPSR